ncbi:2-oxoglutarate dehydrogenase E1 component [Simkania negevensis]|uniref:oxoglutarate dehydrogenase (succinyl-transferring) n=1 Tax=Simkania negevensis (strain ATCC VR-1471 / DSM 27360 / Z) TaxID=331113 RepID=F8L4X2_SIMNZ|nr:2-oxoglutarate dehydrogenase E1 component [Simkania negevensis]CCB88985.1 2-oxoglutarate dehydrogenase E1 component [Simkania negevensis Z]
MNDHRFEYANLANLKFIEQLYSEYLEDPSKVDLSWQRFFEGMAFGARLPAQTVCPTLSSPDLRVFHLIEAYRIFGHRAAHINPLSDGPPKPEEIAELKLETLGFKQSDLSQNFPTCGFLKEETAPLSKIVEALQQTYCHFVGFEYMGMQTPEVEKFIQQQIEPYFSYPMSHEERLRLLHHLNTSEVFESFIHMKYPGQKRFSVEGGETIIPLMHELIDEGGEEGVQTFVLGMAHRGRLNVLANILRKSYSSIFHEFESTYIPDTVQGTGDVKYHMGYSATIETTKGKPMQLHLAANPSHLESVDPVVEGQTRAYQEKEGSLKTSAIVPVLIHGDAAIAGQGVVYETLQFCNIPGYATGGTIHIVINNQVGFTAHPHESRSTQYCTDIAKGFGAPVFHLNAEKPENCLAAARLAMRIRQRFHCDVFLELNCFRKYGHNETDEPGFTQPLAYQKIRDRKNIRDLYRDQSVERGNFSKEEAQACEDEFKALLEKELQATKDLTKQKREVKLPKEQKPSPLLQHVPSGIPISRLKELTEKFCAVPSEFNIHPKVKRIFEDRKKMSEGDLKTPVVDWGMAEYLAYASLLTDGVHVRLSGQDSGRGTFSHRHAILTDQQSQKTYVPLNHLAQNQASFDVYNSPLSEYAVMGFEYGYSLVYEKSLVIWEAQFGDFANGAQITIDQYVVSAEQKWGSHSSFTLLMPHGYEGMGPEHSSARIERFLQLAASDSIYVAVPSTASQFYHILRRQGITSMKKPLMLFSPKALLRFPPSSSPLEAFDEGTSFQEVIDDPSPPNKPNRVLFCTGKVYYDLVQEREKRGASDVAIVRIEQLYPLHEEKIQSTLRKYKGISSCYWVQEEHENMGAWGYISPKLQKLLPEKLELRYVGRVRSASPAAGSGALHKFELAKFLNEAFE